MTTGTLKLRCVDTVGFTADEGGRGFLMPTCMAIRGDGRIFVASRSNPGFPVIVGIQIVTVDHGFFGQIGTYGRDEGQMIWPTALALDNEERLYLADDFLHRITVFDRDGGLLSTWGTKGSDVGELDGPSGLAFDEDDKLLVVDHRNHRIQRFTKDGLLLSTWGSFGNGPGEFNLPWGITKNSCGDIYVADWRNDRIQKFSPEGRFLASYGSSGDGEAQFHRPAGLAVDSKGNMYVADWGNQRVQVLDPDGKFLVALRGDAKLSEWSVEYLESQADEKEVRETFVPVFHVDTDDQHEISARIEPYFWDPVDVVLDGGGRACVLETLRHRFQIYEWL